MSATVSNTRDFPAARVLRAGLLAALAAIALTACSGSGPDTEINPVTTPPNQPTYSGPPPATADVQAFRINLWENIKATNRCGQCHTVGGQTPMFARPDDVNLAYDAANTVVNLTDPSQSRMVLKVGGGHNCWLSSPAACADILTTWITNWAGAAAGGGTQIKLLPPPIKDVSSSRNFPDTPPSAYTGVHNLLTQFCSRCHTSAATTPQSPFFAAADIDESYEAVKTKINLDNPAMSRLVVRLRDEFHNCWAIPAGGAPNCPGSADAMQAAIQAMVNQIPLTQIDPTLQISKALTLYDGTVASGGSRFDGNAIAKWEFKTGSGGTAFDTSGVEPALNLTLSGDVTWVGGWGINIKTGGKAQGPTGASKKLHDLITATGEYSVEAWVAPANVMQEDANIVSYSGGNMARNFTLAQQQYQLDFANRSSATDANGTPSLVTDADDEDLQATLQHIVVTFDPVNGRRVYVNGEDTGDRDSAGNASLSNWDDTFAFVLGNEVSGNRQFTGVYRLVVIHNRVLTPAQIQQNFSAGVGERYFMNDAAALLDGVGQLQTSDEELLALRDKANLALGYAYLQTDQPTNAKPVLQRVRLQGAQSNKALLAVGWADSAETNYREALVPWMELHRRNLLDAAVQESYLAVPYAFAKLNANAQAAEYYNTAIVSYSDESTRIDESIAAIRNGKLLDTLLAQDREGNKGWFWQLENLPQAPESRYLYHLLAGNEFQEGLKNYRDLNFMPQAETSAPAPVRESPPATDKTAPAPTETPQTSAAPATESTSADGKSSSARGSKFGTVDRLELESSSITGNRELPKVLYIVPWKKADLGDLIGRPANSLIDEVLAPVDRDVFKRQIEYYATLNSETAGSSAPTPPPAAPAR